MVLRALPGGFATSGRSGISCRKSGMISRGLATRCEPHSLEELLEILALWRLLHQGGAVLENVAFKARVGGFSTRAGARREGTEPEELWN